MAVTKIHPIKSTLKKALDYITNPVKTDDKLYQTEKCYFIVPGRSAYGWGPVLSPMWEIR